MPDRDPPRALATLGAPAARPLDTPGAQAWHALLDFERSVDELRAAAAVVSDEQLAMLPPPERWLIAEVRAHLATYDRAKRGEGGDG
jgi:hypothetical protein